MITPEMVLVVVGLVVLVCTFVAGFGFGAVAGQRTDELIERARVGDGGHRGE